MDRTEGQDVSSLVAKGMKEHTILPKMERKGVIREMRGQGGVGGGEGWGSKEQAPVIERKVRF